MDLNIAKSRPLFYMCFTLVLSVLFWSNPSDSSAQCKAVGGVKPTHSTKKIILYIENDFASELRQSTPAGGVNDAGLTEQQVRSAIMQMAEIWNLQTRAVPLVYGGSVSHDVVSDFCNSVPVQPNHQAVFVNFKNIMKPGSNGKVLMTVRDGMNCTNDYKELVVWGRLSPSNIAPNTVPINWGLGSQSNIGLFSNTMVHELGHIVGLGHANSIGECKSIMAGGTTCNSTNSPLYSTWGGGRYPFRWDKVCSRSYAHRSLKSRLLGFNSNGAIASADISNKNHEQAAIQSGSAHNSINPYASLFKVNLIAAYEPETDSAFDVSTPILDAKKGRMELLGLQDFEWLPKKAQPGDKFLIAYRTERGHNFLLQWVEILEGEVNVDDRYASLPSNSDDLIAAIQQQRKLNCATEYIGFTLPFDEFIRPWNHRVCGGSVDPIQEPLISNGVDL